MLFKCSALRFSQQLFFPTFSPEYEYDPTISAILKTNLQYHMSVNSILSVWKKIFVPIFPNGPYTIKIKHTKCFADKNKYEF